MYCKQCGFPLPSTGYLCTNCGRVMDSKQIKQQKEQRKWNSLAKPSQMIGLRYGRKDFIFQKREDTKKKREVLLFIFLLVLIGLGFVLLFFLV